MIDREIKNCVICGGKINCIDFEIDTAVSSDSKIVEAPLSHSYCVKCGYIFVNFDKRVDYEKFYCYDYDFLLDDEFIEPTLNNLKYSDIIVLFLSEFLENKSDKKFLDIGAGKGNFLDSLHRRFEYIRLYGLEPSKAYQRLREKNFLVDSYNDFFDSGNFSEKFDYISIIGVLEHVPNPLDFLLDIRRIMHNDSYLLIEVPNFKNNKSDLLTIDHLSKFTPNSINNLFDICGFEVVKEMTSDTVPMQFIIQKVDGKFPIVNCIDVDVHIHIDNAVNYLKKIIHEVESLGNCDIAVYGQGLVLDYLIAVNLLSIDNIKYIINDNAFYQSKKYNKKIPILSFDDFSDVAKEQNIGTVLLCMNDCYHHKVIPKLSNFRVLGCRL